MQHTSERRPMVGIGAFRLSILIAKRCGNEHPWRYFRAISSTELADWKRESGSFVRVWRVTGASESKLMHRASVIARNLMGSEDCRHILRYSITHEKVSRYFESASPIYLVSICIAVAKPSVRLLRSCLLKWASDLSFWDSKYLGFKGPFRVHLPRTGNANGGVEARNGIADCAFDELRPTRVRISPTQNPVKGKSSLLRLSD